ncbi:MAG: CRISPR-associated RAMP protein Csx7 [Candidatus Bathyarchaeia archaeon]
MFSALHNQAKFTYRLEPITGLLIKSGKESFDPTRPEMEFIRTWADLGGQIKEVPFLPGGSIKGIVRSHAERILRTLNLRCCDITQKNGACVSGKEDKKPPYKEHCFACRTFGYTTLASRVRFTDAYPWRLNDSGAEREEKFKQVHTEQRPGVKIDRRLGTAAKGALYDIEIVTSGNFFGEFTMRNYQFWQMALLALVLRDINEGHQRVGAMKSRGLGRVKIVIEDFKFEQYGVLANIDGQIRGIGGVKDIIGPYDLVLDDAVIKPDSFKKEYVDTVRQVFVPNGVDAQIAWEQLAEAIVGSNHWQLFIQRKER